LCSKDVSIIKEKVNGVCVKSEMEIMKTKDYKLFTAIELVDLFEGLGIFKRKHDGGRKRITKEEGKIKKCETLIIKAHQYLIKSR